MEYTIAVQKYADLNKNVWQKLNWGLKMRLLIIQYAGDYREAVQRFAAGGGETYYAQKASVEAVASLTDQVKEVIVLCCITTEPYNEILPNGVRAIGVGCSPQEKLPIKKIIQLIQEQKPTHLLVRTPILEVLRWAIRHQVPTLATLADSFKSDSLRSKFHNYRLATLLNNKSIEWVSNHGMNACLLLQKIGVNPDKIIPWDFDYPVTPSLFSPKTLRTDAQPWKLFYIGGLNEERGVGDLLAAVSRLKANQISVQLSLVGSGEKEFYLNQAKQLGIEENIQFLGLISNDQVEPLMREADLVVVPMRHEYPAGFPLIIYHALCSRTPLIASDHPMFVNYLQHEINSMIFPSKDAAALANCVEKLLTNPTLYYNLSVASEAAWNSLQIPVKWDVLINRWLFDSPQNRRWLREYRLTSGRYTAVPNRMKCSGSLVRRALQVSLRTSRQQEPL